LLNKAAWPLARQFRILVKLRRYSPRTQKSYLWCAARFVRHFMRPPAEMGSKEIRE
jgi:hypothetical protein